jgi:hypothetical protein
MNAPTLEEQSQMWHALYERLMLNAADQAKLQKERGFSDDLIKLAGLRSSHPGNRELIASLAEKFPPAQLAYVGIFYEYDGDYMPSQFFYGLGPTGREIEDPKTRKKKRERKMGVNPVLIPYLDAAGQCFQIKPHKDNVKKPKDIDELDEEYCGLHVYCAHLLRMVGMSPLYTEEHKDFCVVTEGEFKALALIQCGIPAVAVPGIQQIQNPVFRSRLIELLKDTFGKKDVVVCFDNECKDDPKFPKYYKPDEWKRVDTVVYARLTAQKLYQAGIYRTRIAFLPDEWRVHGKADWDGALARFVRDAGDNIAKGTERARKEFLKVLKSAKFDNDCRGLFASTFERIVEARLVKLNHIRQCPIGGKEEVSLGRRFKRLQDKEAQEAFPLGQAFLNTVGKHYIRKGRRWKDEVLEDLKSKKEIAKANKDWLLYRYYEELLLGYPEPISNCEISCHFRLITEDGKMHYLIGVKTSNREATEQHIRITGDQLCRPAELHNFLITYAKAAWMGGIKATQALVADIQADSAFREIHELPIYGHSEYAGLWKFGDRAFTPDCKTILPDENMVFWHNGVGYQTDFDKSKMGDGFKQGAPMLGELDARVAAESFFMLQQHLFDAIGDYDGWLALGQILSYAVHPEVFRTYKGAPGLWFIGRKGSGKSTIAEWLVQIWGFPLKPFPSLTQGTTHNGVARELAKYGCLPAPYDEFDALKTDERVQSMLKNAFGRLSDLKAAFDSTKRTRSVTPETTPFVMGENSSRDAATRSRYVNISILHERSQGDKKKRLREMNASAGNFRHLGHFIMQNRTTFAGMVMDRVTTWCADPAITKFISDQRQIYVSALPYAAFMSAAELLVAHAAEENKAEFAQIVSPQIELDFRTFARDHGQESQKEVAEASFISVFWEDVKTILQIGAAPHFRKFFHMKYADIDHQKRVLLQDYMMEGEGRTPIMYMEPDSVYMIYAQEIRKVDRQPRLSKRDLRAELKREKYWINPPEDGSHRVTFPGHGRESGCWCFDLIEHPNGSDFIELLRQPAEAQQGNL